jgi:hypothetical protein
MNNKTKIKKKKKKKETSKLFLKRG